MDFKKLLLLLSFIPFLPNAFAESQTFSVDFVAGLPQLIGGEVRYTPGRVHFGAGYGFFPINSILQKKVHIRSYSFSDDFTLVPTAEYSMHSISAFIRYFFSRSKPGNIGGFFIQGSYAFWQADAELKADLYYRSMNILPNALSGTISIKQHLFAAITGYQFVIGSNVFLDFGAGVAASAKPSVTTTFNAETEMMLGFLPGNLRSKLDESKKTTEKNISDAVTSFWRKVPVYPMVFMAIGYAF